MHIWRHGAVYSMIITNKHTSKRIMASETNICTISEAFVPFINHVSADKSSFGVTRGKVEVRSIVSSHGNKRGDRFHLSIPYANHSLNWLVVFNASCPEIAPDFEFDDKYFLVDPKLEILKKHMPSWHRWNPNNIMCLQQVLVEFIEYYKTYQIDKLPERVQMEHSMLLDGTEVCREDVEVILLPTLLEPVEARFVIRLSIDFHQLPRHIPDVAVMLQVSFHDSTIASWSRIIPQLFFSTSLQEVIGDPNTLALPAFPASKTLMDYVPEVKNVINERISTIASTFQKKLDYITQMSHIHLGSVIEYDAVELSEITLMLCNPKDDLYYFLLRVELPKKFPQESPKYTLQSLYHYQSEMELQKYLIPTVPYSPRWSPGKMISKALNSIIDEHLTKLSKIKKPNTRR